MKWSCKELHYILCSVLNRSGNLYELPSVGIRLELWSGTLYPDLHLTWISLLPALFYCSCNEYHNIAQEISRCKWFISLHRITFNRIYVTILKVKGKYNLFVRCCSDKLRAQFSVEYLRFRGTCFLNNFHSCTVHLDTIKVFYLPTDAQ